jgi:hypothetical protein
MDPINIIGELEILNGIQELSIGELDALIAKFKYIDLQHYLTTFKVGTKPEQATQELLKQLTIDVLQHTGFSEVKIKGGFVDFAIQENVVNPILIELKPGFEKIMSSSGSVFKVKSKKLEFINHKDQIQKYLTGNDFVILTNLNDSFLFNRDAIIKYEPFYNIKFTELLKMFLDSENLWDTVRRLEDQFVKLELEKQFFIDLNNWYKELSYIAYKEINGFTKSELIVLFINKIIFAKTLEDYGLIPYKFITDEYFQKYSKWEIKGIYKILDNYFTEFEEWFWDYYDTELFRTKIWDFIDKSPENLQKFERIFEKVLGVGKWEYTFGKGMVHYNYRKIDEDVFGKAYETFIAQNRKDSGIYYTHRLITQYMSERLVYELFELKVNEIFAAFDNFDFELAQIKINEMYLITIADTTSGSGSYLIKVFREIYKYYQRIYQKLNWTNEIHGLFEVPKHVKDAQDFIDKNLFNDKLRLISTIILRHIHAIDFDERAIEIAKTNLWKEAVKVEKGIFNFRRLSSRYNHILPNLQINFINADTLYDLPIDVQILELSTRYSNEIKEMHKIRSEYMFNPGNPEILDFIKNTKAVIRKDLETKLPVLTKPTLVCLEFFYLYFDMEGKPLQEIHRGFSGIISNPPWEEIYPVKKEFFDIGKYEMERADFEKQFDVRLKKDEDFAARWKKYCKFYLDYTAYISQNYTYHKLKPESSMSMRSHLNYFKVLLERDTQLLKPNGFLNILVPSSFQTDEGSYGLRKLSFIENTLIELFSFENKGFKDKESDATRTKLFSEVDPRFKFSIVFFQKLKPAENETFKGLFYLLDPKDLYSKEPLEYSRELIRKFSPYNLSIMEFASILDYNLCMKILSEHSLLGQLGYNFRREFNFTDDNTLLSKERINNEVMPVYEGKCIHQYSNIWSEINYYIETSIAHQELISKEVKRIKTDLKLKVNTKEVLEYFIKNDFKLDYQTYRLVYRAVASSTNERTLISTIIPANTVTVNSLNYLINCNYQKDGEYFTQTLNNNLDILYIMALINSLTLNYYIRNKISANLNMFYLYELPIPTAFSELRNKIIELSFLLLWSKSNKIDYQGLCDELNIVPPSNIHQIKIRSELEVLIARDLFGLNKSDWEYLTSTFVFGEDSETKNELDEIISLSNMNFQIAKGKNSL